MDDVEREALALCQTIKDQLKQITDHFLERAKELEENQDG